MSSMCYQTLSFVECLEILRQAKAVRAAFFDGHAPYVVPMGFEWFVNGMQPVVCLMMPKEGRKAEALSVCTQVCLEFEAPDAAAIQVVLAEGKAVPLQFKLVTCQVDALRPFMKRIVCHFITYP